MLYIVCISHYLLNTVVTVCGVSVTPDIYRRLIDKEQRMLAILAQIDSLEEKEEFQRQMTPAERTQLEKYNHAMFM